MAKIKNPLLFSDYFEIIPDSMEEMGILNPTLNIDTKLFIDPILLPKSSFEEISIGADQRFRDYFSDMIILIRAIKTKGDVPWRESARRFNFREIKQNCLGYGAATIHGSALGPKLIVKLLDTAKQIVDLGIEDPDLFKLLPLLEEGMGPDRISDITSSVIFPDLASLTERICKQLDVPTHKFKVNDQYFNLPLNPTEKNPTSILLVPKDILRDLPIASDWSEVADAASKNEEIRRRVNDHIGNIWEVKTRKDKARLRSLTLESKEAFQSLLDLIKTVNINPYNTQTDPEGIFIWRKVRESVAKQYPLKLMLPQVPSNKDYIILVETIIKQFKELIENKGLWKLLWNKNSPQHEHVSQMIFFAVADAYCKANNLDVTPEADTGNGPVDFKFSRGYTERILVEVKLSTNNKLVNGYERQLERYKDSQKPIYSVYLIINVGSLERKYERILKIRNELSTKELDQTNIIIVDGKKKLSASKL